MKIMRTSILLLGALWLVTSHIPINKKCVEFLTSDANISNQTNSFNEICALPKYKPHNELLFVLTTCNHLQYSIQALETLRRSSDSFDLIIIDDYSVDGTTDYLIKKGYPVIVKSSAQGLTHSWNIGYRLGILLQYKYIIFANNDILIPSGAVDALRSDLAAEALVVPLTTLKGAGHNPSQLQYIPCRNRICNGTSTRHIISNAYKML